MVRPQTIPAPRIADADALLTQLALHPGATPRELADRVGPAMLLGGDGPPSAPVDDAVRLLQFAVGLGLARARDRGWLLTDAGSRYCATLSPNDRGQPSEHTRAALAAAIADNMADGIAFGAALTLQLLATQGSLGPSALGEALARVGNVSRWRSPRTLWEQGERYRALVEDAGLVLPDGRLSDEAAALLRTLPPRRVTRRRRVRGVGAPISLVLGWSVRRWPPTIEDHRRVAARDGAVWWGHVGTPTTSALAERWIALLHRQLADDVVTEVHLRGSTTWRARLLAVTDDEQEVDPGLVPAYYRESGDFRSLWVKLTDFEQTTEAAILRDYVLATNHRSISGQSLRRRSMMIVIARDQLERQLQAPPPPASPPPAPAPPPPRFDVGALELDARDVGLELPRAVLAQLVANVEAGKHVILTGPPGTGKTLLAQAVARVAERAGRCSGHVVTTATADWTTYDTIGGLHETRPGTLEFRAGHFLDAIERDRWLVIDELNRSHFDRAFGALFTVLSDHPVVLPHSRPGRGPLALVPARTRGDVPADCDEIRLSPDWRIVATMNVFDKALLFQLSFALMRRFAFVEIPAPSDAVFARLIARGAAGDDEAARLAGALHDALAPLKQLGAAVYMDLAGFLRARLAAGVPADDGQLLFEAFYSHLLPQFEGVDAREGARLHRALRPLVGAALEPRLRTTLDAVLGLELGGAGGRDEGDADLDDEADAA